MPNSSAPLQDQMAYIELHFGNHVSALQRHIFVSTLCALVPLPSASKHRHWCGRLWNKSDFLQLAWQRDTKGKACFMSYVSSLFCSWNKDFPRSHMWGSLWVSVTLHKMVPSYRLQAQRRRTGFGPHSSTWWSPRSVTHIFTHFWLYTIKTNNFYYWFRYFWIILWRRTIQEWRLLQTVIEEFGKEQIFLQHDRGHYSLLLAEARNLTQNANMDTPGYRKFYFQKRVIKRKGWLWLEMESCSAELSEADQNGINLETAKYRNTKVGGQKFKLRKFVHKRGAKRYHGGSTIWWQEETWVTPQKCRINQPVGWAGDFLLKQEVRELAMPTWGEMGASVLV